MIRILAATALLLVGSGVCAPASGASSSQSVQSEREARREARQQERQERREARQRAREEARARGRRQAGRGAVHLRVFRSYSLAEGETAPGRIVVIGGSARLDGNAVSDVVVVGGALRLGPRAVVNGNAVTVGGAIIREPGSVVVGRTSETAVPWAAVTGWFEGPWWARLASLGTGLRLLLVLVVAALLTALAPDWIGSIAARPVAAAGAVGLVAELMIVPVALLIGLVLVISIVGIVAVPFLLMAFGVAWVAGLAGVSVRLGRALRPSRTRTEASVLDLLLGYCLVAAVTVVAHVLAWEFGWLGSTVWSIRTTGLIIEFVAWTIGLGAVVMSLFGPRGVSPPPLPA